MLHNLIILEKETGISIGNVNLTGKDYDDKKADFLSASVKAIQEFFKEMDFGELETFQFLEKKILIYRRSTIVILLICDKDTNLNLYWPKLELISIMFEKGIEWSGGWDGNVSRFNEFVKVSKEVLLN